MSSTKVYKIKKLIHGYLVHPDLKGKLLVAFPEHLFERFDRVKVEFDNGFMVVSKGEKPLHKEEFQDKFGRDRTYRLIYFEWKPVKQESLF